LQLDAGHVGWVIQMKDLVIRARFHNEPLPVRSELRPDKADFALRKLNDLLIGSQIGHFKMSVSAPEDIRHQKHPSFRAVCSPPSKVQSLDRAFANRYVLVRTEAA
jgi:hypothetical protein